MSTSMSQFWGHVAFNMTVRYQVEVPMWQVDINYQNMLELSVLEKDLRVIIVKGYSQFNGLN